MNKYLIRLDDACPTMDSAKWQRMEDILDQNGVRPMVGVIPANKDPKQEIDAEDASFWEKVKKWENKGWSIALHGYDHCYISEKGMEGLNPLWARSEFSGVSLEQQKQKIREGIQILNSYGIDPNYFFAPSHTFDDNTLKALRTESNIHIISDTIATRPYRMGDFVFIPQLGGHCVEMKLSGIWTFCLHPSMMSDANFNATEQFLKRHKQEFIGFDELNLSGLKNKDVFSKLLSWAYFTQRKLKGIK